MFAKVVGLFEEFGVGQSSALICDPELVSFLILGRGIRIGQRIETHAAIMDGIVDEIRAFIDNPEYGCRPSAMPKIDKWAFAREID